jgi:type IV secretory pathway VirB10-like protein
MSNTDHTASKSRQPSLLDTSPGSSTAPEPRNHAEGTRVLADLGGQKPAKRFGGIFPLAGGVFVLAVGLGFWAMSGPSKQTAPPKNIVVAAVTPAPAPPPAPTAVPAPVPTPAAMAPEASAPIPAPEPNAARIVDETAAVAPPKAVAPRPAAAKVAGSKSATTARAAPPKAVAAAAKHSASTVKTAHADAPRDKAHTRSKPAATAVARNARRNEAPTRSASARPGADPDSDLLAALLRRNGGGSP